MKMDHHTIDRRRMLLGSVGVFGGLRLFSSRFDEAGRREDDPRTLVVLQLSGGNDGLSTVVPYADDVYHRVRTSTRITAKEALHLDDQCGLHPELGRLFARFGEGKLAIVEGVGYPGPNRSHFKSLEIWHTGDLRGRASGDGWIGRLVDAALPGDSDPNRVVHVGKTTPYSLHSTSHPAAAFSTPYGYRWVKNGAELEGVVEDEGPATGADGGALALVRARLLDARRSSAAVRAAAVRYRTPVEYPADPLGDDLRTVAALIEGRIGTRVLSVELGGFDTHTEQRTRHDALMRRLDAGLGAFLEDLDRTEAGRAALVLIFSEFGRRVAENGSRGTDHGCAAPMFLAGARVAGGLHGTRPSLTELDEGDLIFGTDFRSVYATAIEACFDVRHEDVLGARFSLLDLIA